MLHHGINSHLSIWVLCNCSGETRRKKRDWKREKIDLYTVKQYTSFFFFENDTTPPQKNKTKQKKQEKIYKSKREKMKHYKIKITIHDKKDKITPPLPLNKILRRCPSLSVPGVISLSASKLILHILVILHL